MACGGGGYRSDQYNKRNGEDTDYLLRNSFGLGLNPNGEITPSSRKCRKYSGQYPDFTPVLSSLSETSSGIDEYKKVVITGENFMPNGTTQVQFGSYGVVPTTYYGSGMMSFVVPQGLLPAIYAVQVINIYNNHFSLRTPQHQAGKKNYSQVIHYQIY